MKNLQQERLEQDRLAQSGTDTGQLEIVILPSGDILEIRDAQNQVVNDATIGGVTPRVLSLPAGSYTVVVRTAKGDSYEDHEIEAVVMAQQLSRITKNFSALDAITYFERSGWSTP